MEIASIDVVEMDGNLALIKARSVKLVNGRPGVEITIKVELPARATQQTTRDVALRYLDYK